MLVDSSNCRDKKLALAQTCQQLILNTFSHKFDAPLDYVIGERNPVNFVADFSAQTKC